MIQRLARAAPEAAAVAPKQAGRWQPLFGRYSVEQALPVVRTLLGCRKLALQQVFAGLGPAAVELDLDAAEVTALSDWDRPADLEPR
jgi:molybdopterin-guanine dinucleotide biosynthesis protein A